MLPDLAAIGKESEDQTREKANLFSESTTRKSTENVENEAKIEIQVLKELQENTQILREITEASMLDKQQAANKELVTSSMQVVQEKELNNSLSKDIESEMQINQDSEETHEQKDSPVFNSETVEALDMNLKKATEIGKTQEKNVNTIASEKHEALVSESSNSVKMAPLYENRIISEAKGKGYINDTINVNIDTEVVDLIQPIQDKPTCVPSEEALNVPVVVNVKSSPIS